MDFGGVSFVEVVNEGCLLCEEERVDDERKETEDDDSDLIESFGQVKELAEYAHPSVSLRPCEVSVAHCVWMSSAVSCCFLFGWNSPCSLLMQNCPEDGCTKGACSGPELPTATSSRRPNKS